MATTLTPFDVIESASATLDKLLDNLLGTVPENVEFPFSHPQTQNLGQQRNTLNEIDRHIKKITHRLRVLRHSTMKAKDTLRKWQSIRARSLSSANELVHRAGNRVHLPSEIISLVCRFSDPPHLRGSSSSQYLNNPWGLHYQIQKPWLMFTLIGTPQHKTAVWRSVLPTLRFLVYFDGGKTGIGSLLLHIGQWVGLVLLPQTPHDHCRLLKDSAQGSSLPNLRKVYIHADHSDCFAGIGLFANVTRIHIPVAVDKLRTTLPQILQQVPLLRLLSIAFISQPREYLAERAVDVQFKPAVAPVELPFLTELLLCSDNFGDAQTFQRFIQSLPFRSDHIKRFQTQCLAVITEELPDCKRKEVIQALAFSLHSRFPELEWLDLGKGDSEPVLAAQRDLIKCIIASTTTPTPLFPFLNHIDIMFDCSLDMLLLLQQLVRIRHTTPQTSNMSFLSIKLRPHTTYNGHQDFVDSMQSYFSNVILYECPDSLRDIDVLSR